MRKLRREFKGGKLSAQDYERAIDQQISYAIGIQVKNLLCMCVCYFIFFSVFLRFFAFFCVFLSSFWQARVILAPFSESQLFLSLVLPSFCQCVFVGDYSALIFVFSIPSMGTQQKHPHSPITSDVDRQPLL